MPCHAMPRSASDEGVAIELHPSKSCVAHGSDDGHTEEAEEAGPTEGACVTAILDLADTT